jgi:transcriptional regulator with XRE-family HTH domain
MTAKRERLVQRRKALGLTQETLAELLSVERSTVNRWERGESEPAPWIQPKLAKALRVSAERLAELLADTGAVSHDAGRNVPLATVPRELPAAVPDFTGRVAELETLTRMLKAAAISGPGTPLICAIGGTAGVGKTALALHWAHQVVEQFPDGQLHMNLRGFDRSGTAVTPEEAILGFLDSLGVPPERIPHAPDAQACLYRSLLADKRMLIMLDNARADVQVRPLLPAGAASLVIVTSRSQLAGLVAADGARLLTLDALTHGEAVQLLAARLGPGRCTAEPEAVAEIATLCACLPLALVTAAARAGVRPSLPLAALATELRDTAGDNAPTASDQPAVKPPRPLGLRSARGAAAAAALAVAAIAAGLAALLTNSVSGSRHGPSPAAGPTSVIKWQCGPFRRAKIHHGSLIDQWMRACIASDHGHVDLEGFLVGSVGAWKEQIILNLRRPGQPPDVRLSSPVCTASPCVYRVTLDPDPASGSWQVMPQWSSDGGYQSTGKSSPSITYQPRADAAR